jgi:hypothetical protein
MRPTPAEARYSAAGEPRPPAPITSARAASSFLAFDADLVEQDVARIAQQLRSFIVSWRRRAFLTAWRAV